MNIIGTPLILAHEIIKREKDLKKVIYHSLLKMKFKLIYMKYIYLCIIKIIYI